MDQQTLFENVLCLHNSVLAVWNLRGRWSPRLICVCFWHRLPALSLLFHLDLSSSIWVLISEPAAVWVWVCVERLIEPLTTPRCCTVDTTSLPAARFILITVIFVEKKYFEKDFLLSGSVRRIDQDVDFPTRSRVHACTIAAQSYDKGLVLNMKPALLLAFQALSSAI